MQTLKGYVALIALVIIFSQLKKKKRWTSNLLNGS